MIKDWNYSLGNYLCGSSVEECMLPDTNEKWLLDFTEGERFEGIDMCISEGRLYFPSYSDGVTRMRSIELTSGKILWEKVLDFGQITPLCVSNGRLCFGYLVLDSNTGEIIADLREAGGLEQIGGLGYLRLIGSILIKTISEFDFSKGFIGFDLQRNQIIPFGLMSAPLCSSNEFILVKDANQICQYEIGTQSVVWSYSLEQALERMFRVTSDGKTIALKNLDRIWFIDYCTGNLRDIINKSQICEYLQQEVTFDSNVKLMCRQNELIVYCDNDNGGWLVSIDLNSCKIVSGRLFNFFGGACLAGGYLFTIDKEFRPLAIELKKLEPTWRGSTPISSHKVIAGSNHIVYGFPAGGFQCYGS